MLRQLQSTATGFIVFLLLVGGCVSDKQVISQADNVHDGIEPAVITDKELDTYIKRLGQRIVNAAHDLERPGSGKDSQDNSWMFQGMEFHFVNSKTLNAFTTGGKHMYIYTELFRTCKNEDELAAVMSHEYAHVYKRHVAKGMNRQYATIAAGVGAGAIGYAAGDEDNRMQYAGAAAGAAMLAGQFLGMGFTRDDETQADEVGFQFYSRAGWDPNRFAGFFQTLIDKGLDKGSEITSDHPKLATRVAATKDRIQKLPANAREWRVSPVADAAMFRQLQQRSTDVGKRMPNDKSLQQAQLMLTSFSSCVSPDDQPDQKQAQATIARAMQQQQKPKPK